MWEKTRVDGTRKLKRNAVPSIFSFSVPNVVRRPLIRRQISGPHIEVKEMSTVCEPNLSETNVSSSSAPTSNTTNTNLSEMETSNVPETKYKKLEDRVIKLSMKLKTLKSKLQISNRIRRRTVKRLQEKDKCINDNKYYLLLKRIFTDDQIFSMDHKMNFRKWSNDTIQKCLSIKFACGNNGYQELLRNRIPLPSTRTLSRRLESLKFMPGILDEIFDFLRVKVNAMEEHEKLCMIAMDEMAITTSNVFDTSSSQYIGKVTLPQHSGNATHALIFMLGGITSRWKQTVAYHFTGDYFIV